MVLIRPVEELRQEFLSVREELTKIAVATARPERGIDLTEGKYGWSTALQSLLTKEQFLPRILECIPDEGARESMARLARALKRAREPQAHHNLVRYFINDRFPGLYEMTGWIYHSSRRMTVGDVPLTEFDLLWVNPAIVDKEE